MQLCFYTISSICLLLLVTHCKCDNNDDNNDDNDGDFVDELLPPRIAIVGAGIGSAALTNFLRTTSQATRDVDITVYERSSTLGGRTASVEYAGTQIDAGASVIHADNAYLVQFAQQLGLKRKQGLYHGVMGIFDGQEFVFQGSEFPVILSLKAFWRYGLSVLTQRSFVANLLTKFNNIYKLQSTGQVYKTPQDMLEALDLYHLTQTTLRETLLAEGVNERMIDELATAVMRVNYGQNSSINAFAGSVSLAAASEDNLWSVEGGNNRIAKGLLTRSGAKILTNSAVTRIRRDPDISGQYLVTCNGTETPYDVVVIATPLETADIQLDDDALQKIPPRSMHTTHATFIVAHDLNPKGFCDTNNAGAAGAGQNNEHRQCNVHSNMPRIVMTTEDVEDFSCIGAVGTVPPITPPVHSLGSTASSSALPPSNIAFVYKVFSRKPLSDEWIQSHFANAVLNATTRIPWLAYPLLTPSSFAPFELAPGLYYANSLETAASAMEISVVGARNVAGLIAKYLLEIEHPTLIRLQDDVEEYYDDFDLEEEDYDREDL